MSDGQVSETQDLTPDPNQLETNDGVPSAADTGHAAQGRPKDYAANTDEAGLGEEPDPTQR